MLYLVCRSDNKGNKSKFLSVFISKHSAIDFIGNCGVWGGTRINLGFIDPINGEITETMAYERDENNILKSMHSSIERQGMDKQKEVLSAIKTSLYTLTEDIKCIDLSDLTDYEGEGRRSKDE